jgi:hypothetical protein
MQCLPEACSLTPYARLFPLQNNNQTHYTQHDRLQPRMLRKHDGNIAHERYEPNHTANDILPLEVVLSLGIQIGIVGTIVVALGEEFRFRSTVSCQPYHPNKTRICLTALTRPQTSAPLDEQSVSPCP